MIPAVETITHRLDKILRELVLIQYEVDTLPDAVTPLACQEFSAAVRRATINFNTHLERTYGKSNDSGTIPVAK